MTIITKTLRELTYGSHPEHFPEFVNLFKDHHDWLHNGYAVITQAVANLKSTLRSGGTVGGVSIFMPCPKAQKEPVLRPTVCVIFFGWEYRGEAGEPDHAGPDPSCPCASGNATNRDQAQAWLEV